MEVVIEHLKISKEYKYANYILENGKNNKTIKNLLIVNLNYFF